MPRREIFKVVHPESDRDVVITELPQGIATDEREEIIEKSFGLADLVLESSGIKRPDGLTGVVLTEIPESGGKGVQVIRQGEEFKLL